MSTALNCGDQSIEPPRTAFLLSIPPSRARDHRPAYETVTMRIPQSPAARFSHLPTPPYSRLGTSLQTRSALFVHRHTLPSRTPLQTKTGSQQIAPSRTFPALSLLFPSQQVRKRFAVCSNANPQVLRVSSDWIAVNKPPGVLIHRTKLYKTPPGETFLVDYVSLIAEQLTGFKQQVFPVQRLDRPTSGVIVFALGSTENAARLQAALQSESSFKQYWALAFGTHMPISWINENPLKDLQGKDRKQRSARTEFEVIEAYHQADVVAVNARIKTGRRHQIRRHLSNSRHPILGDTSYCKGKLNRMARDCYGVTRCCLHSQLLCFSDPLTGDHVRIEASIPEDLRAVQERVANTKACAQGGP
ncbi:tRNA pseudouridine synthase C [Gracilariopsis chorda]|uniref:tRNA pseudouridine synthase C n=1 Tax=Gracilariopsis chorda TaxID=448386 RepID=A0A2V3J654_9FLOR|nr:tRNA pseudouridine synthase C [Gracilariopsis chorda]|eukprot:PXF49906.1 tRNA pseudouridine synthase C [Gracilariopsis chorda]